MGHCCRSSWRCNRLTDADRAMGASAVRALTRRRVTDHRGRVTPVQRGAVCGRHRRRKHHHSAATARCRLMSDQRKRPSQTVGERALMWHNTTQSRRNSTTTLQMGRRSSSASLNRCRHVTNFSSPDDDQRSSAAELNCQWSEYYFPRQYLEARNTIRPRGWEWDRDLGLGLSSFQPVTSLLSLQFISVWPVSGD